MYWYLNLSDTGGNQLCGQAGPFNIIGGREADNGQWPWQASIHVNYRHACGGSVINKRFILTAGHCVFISDQSGYVNHSLFYAWNI